MAETKHCNRCEQDKEINTDNWYYRNGEPRQPCKQCHSERNKLNAKKRRLRNPEEERMKSTIASQRRRTRIPDQVRLERKMWRQKKELSDPLWKKEQLNKLKLWGENNPDRASEAYRRYQLNKLGWTLEEYKEELIANEGRCYICGTKTDKLDADHCHKCGKRRHLLCGRCNRFLGAIHENKEILVNMIKYVEEHEKVCGNV